MQTETFNIEGMSCTQCAGHVARALEGVAGVQSAQVSLEEKRAIVTFDPGQAQVAQMQGAVAEEGYAASVRA